MSTKRFRKIAVYEDDHWLLKAAASQRRMTLANYMRQLARQEQMSKEQDKHGNFRIF